MGEMICGAYLYTDQTGKVEDIVNISQGEAWEMGGKKLKINWKQAFYKGTVEQPDFYFNSKFARLAIIYFIRNKNEWKKTNEELEEICSGLLKNRTHTLTLKTNEPHHCSSDMLLQIRRRSAL